MSKYKLIGVGTNAKTIKGDGSEYETAILYMAPFKVVVDGKTHNSCAMAEQAGCVKPCLNLAGRGAFSNVISARLRKATWFYQDRAAFMAQLAKDVAKFAAACAKKGVQPCVRLNGTTDIRWELIKLESGLSIFEAFPDVQFYDYTKISNRKVSHLSNYHLTWSYSGANASYAAQLDSAIANGMNAAVVFRDQNTIPAMWQDYAVIDGDKDDLRHLDPKGVIVALYAKGPAKKDTSGFVVDA